MPYTPKCFNDMAGASGKKLTCIMFAFYDILIRFGQVFNKFEHLTINIRFDCAFYKQDYSSVSEKTA